MRSERWNQIKNVLAAALKADPSARSSYLDGACANDPSLRREVESLLEVGDESPNLLQPPDQGICRLGLPAGTKLGDYEVEAPVGAGGMGEVYRARDLRLGRNVALKILPRLFSSNPDRLQRFEQEARAAAALNHPNILSVYQLATHEGAPYLVSELLEGETLRSLVGAGPLPLDRVLNYSLQICRGLAAAHRKGVVHRDLKLENLFLTSDGAVKILDFGLAKITHRDFPRKADGFVTREGSATQAGMVLGTAGYMSPEQVLGRPTDQRSDIFSFGAIVYEMLAGTRAFHGQSFAEAANAILNDMPSELPLRERQIPESVRNLVWHCLEKEPPRRYQTAEEILADLESISESVNSARDGARHDGRRRRWQTALIVACMVVVCGAGAILLRFTTQTRTGHAAGSPAPDSEAVLTPLVSLPGEEHMPAASPDGRRFAFLWLAPDPQKSGIYVVEVGSQSLVRLTESRQDYSPTWSPDGRQIAFLRDVNGRFSILLVPALGGPERRLYVGRRSQVSQGYPQATGLSFSPDGKWLAFSEADPSTQSDSIKLLSLEDSSIRSISSHPPGFQDRYPVFSPSGHDLAFIRSAGPVYIDELYVTSLESGDDRKLTSDHHRIFGPPAFMPDGREVVFSSSRAGLESLWRISVLGGNPQPVSMSGPGAQNPTISQKGELLAYEINDDEQNIWRLKLHDETHVQGVPEILIASARTYNLLPQFSPDGSKIAFQSNRSGYAEIWICDAGGSNPVQVTDGRTLTGSPRWSPDGHYLTFDSRPGLHSEIDVVEVPHGSPHTIARLPDAESVIPSWSHDGKWIFFSSNQGGKDFHLWKVGVMNGVAASGGPLQISKAIGFNAMESIDGRSILFANPPNPGIWSVPPEGGQERIVWNGPGPDLWSNWVPTKNGIYLLSPGESGPEIEFFNFATRQVTRLARLDRPSFYGLALSPDQRSLIYSQQDRNDHQILLVKNFH